jgi:O-antigen ligase
VRIDRSELSTCGLVLLFVTVFFSVFLQQMAAGVGWLSAFVKRTSGDAEVVRPWPAPTGLVAPLALFLLASVLSATSSIAPVEGWRMIGKELFAIGIALAGAGILRAAHARAATTVLLIAAAIAGSWSVYQVVFVFGGVSDPGHRATGFWHLGAFVSHGSVLAMVFALALGFAAWSRRRVRTLALVSGGLMAIGMVLSYTRASWITSAALVSVVSVWRRAFVPLIALLLLGGTVLAPPVGHVVMDRARSIFDQQFVSNADHLVRYRVGAAVIRDHPLLGTGPGVLKLVYPRYALPGAMDNWHLHNTYLQLLAERGRLSLGAWLLAMGWGVVNAFRSAACLAPDRKGLAVGVGLSLTAVLILAIFNNVWEDWRIRSLTLAFLGLAWSPAVTDGESGAEVASRQA